MILVIVERDDNGTPNILKLTDVDYPTQAAFEKGMRDNPAAFIVDQEYCLVVSKPIVKFTVTQNTVIEKGEKL